MHKLLSINNYYYLRGGAEKVFLDHNELMADQGWAVAPFAMKGEKNQESEWSRYFVDEIEFGESYSLTQKMVNAVKIIHSREAQTQVAKLVQDFKPSIAHGHNIYHHLSTSILVELHKLGVPVVLNLHDLKLACPAYTMLRDGDICEDCKGGVHNVFTKKCMKGSTLLSALVYLEALYTRTFATYRKNVDAYVVPSQFYIDKFVEWGFPREQFVYIPNYVEQEPAATNVKFGDYFVYAGRLSREKGLPTLVQAAAQQNTKLVVAGSGPEEAAVKTIVEQKAAHHISFAGYLNKQELASLVEGCRGVIVPSEWYENCPMSILEAFGKGKPVIGSDIGGISEMIDHGVDGLKFTAGSVDELRAAMVCLAEKSDGQLQQMGEAARMKIRDRFSKQNYLEKTLALYQRLLG